LIFAFYDYFIPSPYPSLGCVIPFGHELSRVFGVGSLGTGSPYKYGGGIIVELKKIISISL
jgi:hypothetical protein